MKKIQAKERNNSIRLTIRTEEKKKRSAINKKRGGGVASANKGKKVPHALGEQLGGEEKNRSVHFTKKEWNSRFLWGVNLLN